MTNERIYLMKATGVNPNTLTSQTFYWGTSAFRSASTDTPADTYFEPRINNPGLSSQSMYSPGATSGNSTGGYGIAELNNTDGGLDNLIGWGFDGGLFEILEGPKDAVSLTEFSTIIAGTIEQIEHTWLLMTFRFKDNTLFLDRPIALNYYLGNNILPAGLEGVATDLKDKAKPRMWGSPPNITPICVNTSKLVYQYNDGNSISVTAVRDNGVALTFGSNYTTSALLLAATTAASHYDTCIAESYIRLGSSPSGQITMDAVVTNISIGQTFKTLAIEKLGANSVVEQSIIDLDKVLPASVVFGYYTGSNGSFDSNAGTYSGLTTKSVFDELAKAGIWWGFDNNGKLWVKQFSASSAINPLLHLDQTSLLSVERVATSDSNKGVVIWKVTCRYAHNYSVQKTLAGSLVQTLYATEWLETTYQDASIKTLHPLAETLIIDTPYINEVDALAEATRQFNLRSVKRDRLKVTLPMVQNGPVKYQYGGYWDDEAIAEMPYSLNLHSSIIFNNWLYVFGGSSNGGGFPISKVIRLDLSNPTGAWDDAGVTDLPYAVESHSIVLFGNYVYIIGGMSTGLANISKVIRLDLSNPTGAWDDAGVTDLPTNRNGHSSIIFNNYVYVMGGYTTAYTASSIRLDLNNPTGAWDDAGVTDLPYAKVGKAATLYGSVVYILQDQAIPSVSFLSLDLSNPTGAWVFGLFPISPLGFVYKVYGHSLFIKNDYMYLTGGQLSIDGVFISEYSLNMRLDLTNTSKGWEMLTNVLDARAYNSCEVYNNSIYLIGGYKDANVSTYSNTWRLRTNDNANDLSELTSLGRTVLVTIPRYNYSGGVPMKIISTESNHKDRQITLDLWG